MEEEEEQSLNTFAATD